MAIPNKGRLILAATALAVSGAVSWELASIWQSRPVMLRGSGDIVTIAATGDVLVVKPKESQAVQDLLRGTSVSVANLEENLLDPERIPRADDPAEVRWPYGTKQVAQALRRYGFSILSLANNHAVDYGTGGLTQTAQILDGVGVLHAGTGEDLAQARAPVFLGTAPRRVAMISVATSASPESRATPSRGEIMGRPGVNALKYAADVTVDASVFAALQHLPAATPDSKPDNQHLIVAGKTIKKGDRTVVDFRADDRDENEILAQIRQARAQADIVILTVNSHEPSNRSPAPAAFLQQFAHAAVDAGASLLIGQGPHQLRGVEVYKTGMIFYSLGNFAFDFSEVKPQSEDVFEAGIDLYRLALGAIAESENPPPQSMEDPRWSQSVIALASFRRGELQSARLYPIDLGVDLPLSQRGTPHFAAVDRGTEILSRMSELSREFGTQIHIANGMGMIDR